ncbi:MAG: DUF3299 domain-containing protein [Candidatus Hydrogenedentes bacterium]|nr:DUF3299 domain-containing protein [Candidatus Hydrogenedentota bacterium]
MKYRYSTHAIFLAGFIFAVLPAWPQKDGAEIKGAPIDAPAEAPADGTSAQPGGAPQGQTLGKALPQASLDLLQKAEGDAAKDPMKFEKTKDGKYLKVTFNALGSFPYEVPDPDAILASPTPNKPLKDQIPPKLKELNTQPAVVVGFMVPVEVDNKGGVKSFALTQNQMYCCFGVPPSMNEWVMVNVQGEPAKYYSDMPVAAFGTLEVGEEFEDGYVMSVYRLKCEKVMDVRELLQQSKG